jgi:hypothetical protein
MGVVCVYAYWFVANVDTIDEKNRPCDSYFYCGSPSYYKLKYQIYRFLSAPKQANVSPTSFVLKERLALERILGEAIPEKKVWHMQSEICHSKNDTHMGGGGGGGQHDSPHRGQDMGDFKCSHIFVAVKGPVCAMI